MKSLLLVELGAAMGRFEGLAFPTSVVLGCLRGGGWLVDALPLVDLIGGGFALSAVAG